MKKKGNEVTINMKQCQCGYIWPMRFRVCGVCGADLRLYGKVIQQSKYKLGIAH